MRMGWALMASIAAVALISPPIVDAQVPVGTALTYQGQLWQGDEPYNGPADFQFALYNDPNAGGQIGDAIPITDKEVVDGLFTVVLDFGAEAFNGDARWLEIYVNGTLLSPRQELTPAPYALYALNGGLGGSGTAGYVSKFTDAITLGDSVIYEDDGKVGIATATPDARLQLHTHSDVPSLLFSGGDKDIAWSSAERLQLGQWDGETFTERMRFNWDGNVGIGTIEPLDKLHVLGTLGLDSGPSGAAALRFRDDAGLKWTFLYRTWESDEFGLYNEDLNQWAMTFRAGTNRVGVGTTDPQARLHVAGGAGPAIRAERSDGAYAFLVAGAGGPAVTGHSPDDGSGTTSGYLGGDYGVHGFSDRDNGRAVSAIAQGSGASAVYGHATQGYGGYFVGHGYFSGNVDIDGDVDIGTPVGGAKLAVTTSSGYAVRAEATQTDGTGLFATGGADGSAADFRGNVRIFDHATNDLVMELGTGFDFAEGFDVVETSEIEPGSVLVIDPRNPGKLKLSDQPYDKRVAGIVAGANGLGSGVHLGAGLFDHSVALAGRVYCKVDATYGAVEVGDLLTTSSRRGYAMKVTDHATAQGAILGKAMESLEQGERGQILVLVTLQ